MCNFCANGDTKLTETVVDVISAYCNISYCFATDFKYLVMCDMLDRLFLSPLDPI